MLPVLLLLLTAVACRMTENQLAKYLHPDAFLDNPICP